MKDIEMQEPHHSKPASVPHCLFCDSLNPWFSCDCETARAVQAGKYPKPKVRNIDGNTIIELHPDLLAITQKIGRFAAYKTPQPVNIESNRESNESNKIPENESNNQPESNSESNSSFDRAAYQREYMRKKRDAAKKP